MDYNNDPTWGGVFNTMNSIDNKILDLGNKVNDYLNNVAELQNLHDNIIRYAYNSENTILFLMNLSNALKDEIDQKENARDDVTGIMQDYKEQILQRNETITNLTNDITKYQQIAQDLQNRANTQLISLNQFSDTFSNNNNIVKDSREKLAQVYKIIDNKQYKRKNEIDLLKEDSKKRKLYQQYEEKLNADIAELNVLFNAVDNVQVQQGMQQGMQEEMQQGMQDEMQQGMQEEEVVARPETKRKKPKRDMGISQDNVLAEGSRRNVSGRDQGFYSGQQ